MSKINIQTDTVGVLNSGRVRGGSLDLTLASGTAPFMRAASAPASPTVGQWYMDSATGALSFCQSAGSWTALSTAVVSGAVAGAGNIPATAGLIAFGSGTAGTITTDTAFTYTPGANPYAQIGSTVQVVLQSLGGSSYGRIGTISNHPFHIVTNNSNRLSFEASGAATFALTIAAKGGTIQDTTAVTGSTLFTITPGAAQTAASTVLSVGGAATFAGNVILGNSVSGFAKVGSRAYVGGSGAGESFLGVNTYYDVGSATWKNTDTTATSAMLYLYNGELKVFNRAAGAAEGVGTTNLTIANTGAATFASTVTAKGATIYDATATTGSTTLTVQAGAGQSFNPYFQVKDNAGGANSLFRMYTYSGNLFMGAQANTDLVFETNALERLRIAAGGAATFASSITSNGHMLWTTDATYDIGASGATRPRNLYASGTGIFGGSVTATGYKTTTTTVASTATLTAAQTSGTVLSNYGQSAEATLTLPAAAEGLGLTFIVTTTGNALHIKAGASDKIYLDGAALDDGDKVSLATPAVGDAVSCLAFRSGESTWDWLCTSIAGAWTDGGA